MDRAAAEAEAVLMASSAFRGPDRASLRSDEFVHVPPYLGCRFEDLQDAWRFASTEAELSYRRWAAGGLEAADAFAAYRAALDREQQAAEVVAEAAGKVSSRRRRRRGQDAP
jgi:hypothetical protein